MTITDHKKFSVLIRERAYELGFDLFGIAPSAILTENGKVLDEWCGSGMNAEMGYLGSDIEKRINPGLVLPGTKSVIVTGLNYYTGIKQGGNGIPVLSRYAYGTDYHYVIKKKLDLIIQFITETNPEAICRSFVDSAPVLEKEWATRAGLGWRGKNSIIINQKSGSFFFIGVIFTSLDLDYGQPVTEDHCGSCRLCIEACPSAAINTNRTIDGRRCLAYLTIESKIPVTGYYSEKLGGMIFGCDICQEVCPWNKNAKPHKTAEFEMPEAISRMSASDWRNMTKSQFKKLFKRSPIGRKKYETFIQNVTNVTK